MKEIYQRLEYFRDTQAFVSIARDKLEVDDVEGFVIHFSESLVLLQYLYDFHLDGYMLIRAADITEIAESETGVFQKGLLMEEGEFGKIDFEVRPPIFSIADFLCSLPNDEIVILEDEAAEDSDFIIGRLIAADDGIVSVRYFDGTASWLEQPSMIETSRITSCRIKCNYINYYARYFIRKDDL